MSQIIGNRPFGNAIDFNWVHRDSSIFYDETKEFDSMLKEFAFLRFDVEVVIAEYLEGLLNTVNMKNGVVVGCNEHVAASTAT